MAQESVVDADPIVVTLSTLPFPLSVAPGSVTVIDRAAIEASRAVTLEDVLRAAPFVDLSRTGGRGGLTTVTLRGGDPNFTLVLLDGVPLNDPTNLLGGSFDFSTLSADNVERVEIVRGPLSSRFGSEALAGVIHVVSRRGRQPARWSAEAALGSFGAREARLGGNASRGVFDVSASASWIELDEQVELDAYRLATGAMTAGVAGRAGELRLTARFHDVEVAGFPANGGGPRFSILREVERSAARELVLGVEARRALHPRWTLTAAADGVRRHGDVSTPAVLDTEPPGPLSRPSLDQATVFDRRRLAVTSAWDLGRLSLIVTGEARREKGDSDGVIAGEVPADFALDRTTRSGAGEIAYQSARLSLDLALRLDAAEGFESQLSPRMAAAWRPSGSGTRVVASWGEGFKLPSFFALGEPNVGNPELRAERSRGYDVGVTQEIPAARLDLSMTWFRQRYRDLIDFSPDEFRLVNRRLARTAGVEAEAAWRVHPSFRVTAFVRWLDAELEGTDEPLRDRPRWKGGAVVGWDAGTSQARLETVVVGERFDFQIPVPERTIAERYAVASLAVSRRVDRVTAFARIDNLLDADYQEFVGFPAPGRSLRVGLRYGS